MRADEDYMRLALACAAKARAVGEVPVGAVVVYDGDVISEAWNQPITKHDPTAPAEIVAMREAAKKLKNYRLIDTTLYVTLEPCLMCMGAIVHARIARLVFGAYDPKVGAAQKHLSTTSFNHRVDILGGILEDECKKTLREFFKAKR